MDEAFRGKIPALLDRHRLMTVATLRPDGWPQATTVGYVNEGSSLYFPCGPESQKAANLARDDRVSLTSDGDAPSLLAITGLSMAAHARPIEAPGDVDRILRLFPAKFPEYLSLPVPAPKPDEIRVFRVTPVVISVLDYSLGFGHTDLVTC